MLYVASHASVAERTQLHEVSHLMILFVHHLTSLHLSEREIPCYRKYCLLLLTYSYCVLDIQSITYWC